MYASIDVNELSGKCVHGITLSRLEFPSVNCISNELYFNMPSANLDHFVLARICDGKVVGYTVFGSTHNCCWRVSLWIKNTATMVQCVHVTLTRTDDPFAIITIYIPNLKCHVNLVTSFRQHYSVVPEVFYKVGYLWWYHTLLAGPVPCINVRLREDLSNTSDKTLKDLVVKSWKCEIGVKRVPITLKFCRRLGSLAVLFVL